MLLKGRGVGPLMGGEVVVQFLGQKVEIRWLQERIAWRRVNALSLRGQTRIRKGIVSLDQEPFVEVRRK